MRLHAQPLFTWNHSFRTFPSIGKEKNVFARNTTLIGVLATVLYGCVSVQMPEVAQTHPAHPDAERAVAPQLPSVLSVPAEPVVAPPLTTSGDGAMPAGHGGHAGHGSHSEPVEREAMPEPMDAVYVCPMHPEIVRDEPGTCPLCGMDLVLQGES